MQDATNCEASLCLPVLLIRSMEKAIGEDTRPARGDLCLLSPFLARVLANSTPLKKDTVTSSLCAALCGHKGTESCLQQMSCGADYK